MKNNFFNNLFEREILELKTIQNNLRKSIIELSFVTGCFFPLLLTNINGLDLSFLFWGSTCGTLVIYAYQIEVTYRLNKAIKNYECDKKCKSNY